VPPQEAYSGFWRLGDPRSGQRADEGPVDEKPRRLARLMLLRVAVGNIRAADIA
jgi:hypothetical protein